MAAFQTKRMGGCFFHPSRTGCHRCSANVLCAIVVQLGCRGRLEGVCVCGGVRGVRGGVGGGDVLSCSSSTVNNFPSAYGKLI